jgi:hypothetical protein
MAAEVPDADIIRQNIVKMVEKYLDMTLPFLCIHSFSLSADFKLSGVVIQ